VTPADDVTRRRFLARVSTTIPAATLLGGVACSRSSPGAAPSGANAAMEDQPLFRISLAQWSMHRALKADEMDPLDFARVAREEYDIEAIEYVNSFYRDHAEDETYLADLARRADDHGVRSLLIMVDGMGALGDADDGARAKAIERHRPWIAAAKRLGCHSIRVNAQSSGSRREQHDRAVDGLRRLTEHAAREELNVIVENHGGLSSDGAWLSGVIRAVNHPRCGTLPDFGNFRVDADTWYDRYRGVEELMPYAKAVSAKSHDFDGDGNETRTDFGRMIDIVLKAGYGGYIGIEYEGKQLSEPDGIRATKTLLERVRAEHVPLGAP
jgi:sugar phosphate isomerase/epimerase